MLRLRAQTIQRLGSSHISATCLVPATRRPLASGLSQSGAAAIQHYPRHTASLFTSSPLSAEAPEAPSAPENPSGSSALQSADTKPNKRKRRSTSKRAKPAVSAKSENAKKPDKPDKPDNAEATEKSEKSGKPGKRQGKLNPEESNGNMQRLRGALAALETVLSEQNIQVSRSKQPKKNEAKGKAVKKEAKNDKPTEKEQQPGEPPGANTAPANPKKTKGKNKSKSKATKRQELEILHLSSRDLNLVPIEKPRPPVLPLAYGLDRVLFNPGVYHLQDPRSRVYNFDPYLANIMPLKEFDFAALKQYVTSSKDETLIGVAREHNKTYTGSTSSMTTMLSHFHYLLSAWRDINPSMMSKDFAVYSSRFTKIMRAPAAIFLHYKDGVYAIDADKEFDRANILSMLGKSMEKLLTLPTEEYERYRRINSDQITEEERNADEAFHYTGLGDFMMRSQLDAHDRRLPGTGMYDLKTRAVISIRMDVRNFQRGLGYEIRQQTGDWESFEREYYDMIRSAFLKYSLQVRMGRMDGIFVAYHNTERIFGFQYVPLEDMDLAVHGTDNRALGDNEFKLSLGLLNQVLDRAKNKFPKQSLRLHFETRGDGGPTPFMYIFAKPVSPGEIQAVQEAGKEAIEQFENEFLYGKEDSEEADIAADLQDRSEELQASTDVLEQENTVASWEDVQAAVEDAVEDEELGMGAVREAIESALEESGLLEVHSPEESRGYVEALLAAVTDHIRPSREESTDPSEDNEVDNTGEESAETSGEKQQSMPQEQDTTASEGTELEVQKEDEPGVLESPTTTLEHAPASDDMETAGQEEPKGQEETNKQEETDGQEEPAVGVEVGFKNESSSDPSISSLRRLILHMTRSLEEKRLASQEKRHDDSSKLQEFEEILRRLIVRSRQDQEKDHEAQSGELSSTSGQSDMSATDAGSTSEAAEEHPSPASPGEAEESTTPDQPPEEVFGMILTARNKVNGAYVQRPSKMNERDEWMVEYNVEELEPERANRLYAMCKKRRQAQLDGTDKTDSAWKNIFAGQLYRFTTAGRAFREKETAYAKTRPVWIFGDEEPKTFEEVFGGTHQYASRAEEFVKTETDNA